MPKQRAVSRQLKSRRKHKFFTNRVSKDFKIDAYIDKKPNVIKEGMRRNYSQQIHKRVKITNKTNKESRQEQIKSKPILLNYLNRSKVQSNGKSR